MNMRISHTNMAENCISEYFSNKSSLNAKAFLKWAGGKRWLAKNYPDIFPVDFNNYIEPFLGSAAIFFHLAPRTAILADVNQDLINTYKALKDNWRAVLKLVRAHHNAHTQEYYYKIRSSNPTSAVGRAAKFIYLNRACWNGLYRVNMQGKFNVPIGTSSTILRVDDDFEAISLALSNTKLICLDFEKTIDYAQKGDLLFVDPPYTVRHNYNGFVQYNETLFAWEDQERLAKAMVAAQKRGVKIVSTNAFHDSIIDLYQENFELSKVTRFSSISGKPESRKHFEELLIISL